MSAIALQPARVKLRLKKKIIISHFCPSEPQFPHLYNRSHRWVKWLMSVIPTLWEAEAGRSRGQEIETSLANMVTPCLY